MDNISKGNILDCSVMQIRKSDRNFLHIATVNSPDSMMALFAFHNCSVLFSRHFVTCRPDRVVDGGLSTPMSELWAREKVQPGTESVKTKGLLSTLNIYSRRGGRLALSTQRHSSERVSALTTDTHTHDRLHTDTSPNYTNTYWNTHRLQKEKKCGCII